MKFELAVTRFGKIAPANGVDDDGDTTPAKNFRLLKDEEVKQIKVQYLDTKEKKENIMKSLGLNPIEENTNVNMDALGNIDFDEAKFSIRDKLRALKENKEKKK